MKLNLKLKVYNRLSIRHKVHVTGFPLDDLKETGDKYFLIIKKENVRHKVFIRMLVDKSVVWQRQNIEEDSFSIIFKGNNLNIFIKKLYAVNKIKRQQEMYCISYASKYGTKLLFEIKNYIKKEHYHSEIQPRIVQARKKNSTKNKGLKTNAYSPEELRRKDFYDGDKFAFQYSQNSDGNRSKREVFGGDFSNMSKAGKKLR